MEPPRSASATPVTPETRAYESAGTEAASDSHSSGMRQRLRISQLITAEELHDLVRANDSDPYINLHGFEFRLQGPIVKEADEAWSDFTEDAYCELLKIAGERYRFATYVNRDGGQEVLWRHDLDSSIHRAVRLAELERAHGATATYFFGLRQPFYNMLEPTIQERAREILKLGHRAGLHFDPHAYREENWTLELLEAKMVSERDLLSTILDCTVEAVSFHDPSAGNFLRFDQSRLAGMVNAYSRELREGYGYCSDSNGHWRFAPIKDVLLAQGHPRLQVLTHPEWWTPEPQAPRRRIERAVLGRARAVMRDYDAHLARSSRRNIG